MTALGRFQASIEGALHLYEMYTELRRYRGLGSRGRLDADNEDLLWMPRSSVVMSISALDAFVHSIICDRAPSLLEFGKTPDELLKLFASLLPVKDGKGFSQILEFINSHNPVERLTDRLRENLSFISYQAPEKIAQGFQLIGVPDIFSHVADIWQGPNSSAEDIKRTLARYCKRRNQIAHEGDVETNNNSRPISPKYAKDCHDFILALVYRMDRVVYGD